MIHRFFIRSDWLTPPTVSLHDDTARQIKTVLRMQPGDTIVVLDNSGLEWQVVLTAISQHSVEGRIVSQQPAAGEPALRLTLYQGTLKAQKFEWVLQKGTELGVARFVPTICARSVANKPNALAQKRSRWQRIIQEAAEQSHRGKLPDLEQAIPLSEATAQAQANDLMIMPWEAAAGPSLRTILTRSQARRVAVFIGPEGGFSAAEAAMAQAAGAHLVTLGPRILRAETAGPAVCTAILYEMGEWG